MPGRKYDNFNFIYNPTTGAWEPETQSASTVITKTALTTPKEITLVYGNARDRTSAIDTTNYKSVTFYIDHGAYGTYTPGVGTEYRIEASAYDDGHEIWTPVASFRTGNVTPTQARTSLYAVPGQAYFTLNPTAGYTLSEYIFVRNVETLANSEWCKIYDINVNNYLYLIDEHVYTQSSSVITNQAFRFMATVNVESIKRLRAVCDNALHDTAAWLYWRCEAVSEE